MLGSGPKRRKSRPEADWERRHTNWPQKRAQGRKIWRAQRYGPGIEIDGSARAGLYVVTGFGGPEQPVRSSVEKARWESS